MSNFERERSKGHAREAWEERMQGWNTNSISCRILRKNLLASPVLEPFVHFDPSPRPPSRTFWPFLQATLGGRCKSRKKCIARCPQCVYSHNSFDETRQSYPRFQSHRKYVTVNDCYGASGANKMLIMRGLSGEENLFAGRVTGCYA